MDREGGKRLPGLCHRRPHRRMDQWTRKLPCGRETTALGAFSGAWLRYRKESTGAIPSPCLSVAHLTSRELKRPVPGAVSIHELPAPRNANSGTMLHPHRCGVETHRL